MIRAGQVKDFVQLSDQQQFQLRGDQLIPQSSVIVHADLTQEAFNRNNNNKTFRVK